MRRALRVLRQPALLRDRMRTSLWLLPTAMSAVAFVLAQLLCGLDRRIAQDREAFFLFGGQAESAREVLSTISSSVLTITGVVFSITILVLQLASQQFSPRVIRTFLEDRSTQLSLGVLVGTFVYSLVVLGEVRSEFGREPGFVPALAIFGAFVGVLVAMAVFIRYLHHMAHSIRAVTVVARIAGETRERILRLHPPLDDGSPRPAPPRRQPDEELRLDDDAGVVTHVDLASLVREARRQDVFIALVPNLGDFVPRGAVLVRVWGPRPCDADRLLAAVVVRPERTLRQDPAFGLRQLVDVAERALSPGVNDPTTAVQALDRIHDLLRLLATRATEPELHADDDGEPRVFVPHPDFDEYVTLGLEEIRHYGERSVQVLRRIEALLVDLLSVAPPSRRGVLRKELALTRRAAGRGLPKGDERRRALQPSARG